jgi:hypothetical protein
VCQTAERAKPVRPLNGVASDASALGCAPPNRSSDTP